MRGLGPLEHPVGMTQMQVKYQLQLSNSTQLFLIRSHVQLGVFEDDGEQEQQKQSHK